nr:hypothetical protein [Tanacetum cinerariifolium]
GGADGHRTLRRLPGRFAAERRPDRLAAHHGPGGARRTQARGGDVPGPAGARHPAPGVQHRARMAFPGRGGAGAGRTGRPAQGRADVAAG